MKLHKLPMASSEEHFPWNSIDRTEGVAASTVWLECSKDRSFSQLWTVDELREAVTRVQRAGSDIIVIWKGFAYLMDNAHFLSFILEGTDERDRFERSLGESDYEANRADREARQARADAEAGEDE
jgi:hypothetical protein